MKNEGQTVRLWIIITNRAASANKPPIISPCEGLSFADGADAAFHDAVGGQGHGAVVEAVELVEQDVVAVAVQPHHAPEVSLLFVAAVELQLAVAREDEQRHGQRAYVPERGGDVEAGSKRSDARPLADVVVGDDLGAVGEGAGDVVGIDAVFGQPALVEDHHVGQIASGRVPADEDASRAAAAFFHFAEGPCYGSSGVVDDVLHLGAGQQAVVDTDDAYAGTLQLAGNLLAAAFKPAAVEPDDGGEVGDICGVVEVEVTTFGGVVVGIGVVGDVALGGVVVLGDKAGCESQAGEEELELFH